MGKPFRRARPEWVHGSIALVLTLLGTVALLFLFRLRVTPFHLLGCWLAALNPITFGYYGYDKWRARRSARVAGLQGNHSRVPEVVLHGLSLAGGSPGAYAGMNTFRHKTIKGRFRLIFWSIVILQLALGIWILWHIARGRG